ncbi:MAG TPA: metallophosphoesterase [Acidimicrobiia bacterium]|nr:metallophosphoesterase [Acidimicrobiia bacterium]
MTVLAVAWLGLVAVPRAEAADPVLLGAGDISGCQTVGDAATAALVGNTPGGVFTLGDNAYESGTANEFAGCFGPTWGRFKGRIRPAVGNHEYLSPGATPYFNYFGSAAGPRGKGWYSYNVGAWHVIVLNANCDQVGCQKGSEQEKWLRADLAAHASARCTLAYWHQARFVSDTNHGSTAQVGPFWDALYQYGADLVLSAHAHVYERFAPQTPQGRADPARGIREIVAGTGGESHYGFGTALPNSQVRNASTFGVLKLTLHRNTYDWRFLPAFGKGFSDSGTGTCH